MSPRNATVPLCAPEASSRLRALLGASTLDRDVYLSTDEAAEYVGHPSRDAFIKWARRHDVPLRKPSARARRLIVRKGDLDWALRVR